MDQREPSTTPSSSPSGSLSSCEAFPSPKNKHGWTAPDERKIRPTAPASKMASSSSQAGAMEQGPKKAKKKKVLLMGKSGSGKSSMRSIIFSNYVAKDTRRLGATIDVEHSHVKFLGNLTLNLWDCGGQDAFVENYLNSQRVHVFSHVGVLIYVFDIESREFDRDLVTFSEIIRALGECSPEAAVFCLIHKMDLVQDHFRVRLYEERVALVKARSRQEKFEVTCFATTIWDQSLYKAWASIIYTLIPNLDVIEGHLKSLAEVIDAEEIVLFERTTFLVVTSFTSEIGKLNPDKHRFERLSNIIKTFKQSLAKHTGQPKSSPQFLELTIKVKHFNLFIARFTANTYILVVVPPGEATFNGAVLNTRIAVAHFEAMDGLGTGASNASEKSAKAAAGLSSPTRDKAGASETETMEGVEVATAGGASAIKPAAGPRDESDQAPVGETEAKQDKGKGRAVGSEADSITKEMKDVKIQN